MPLGREEIFGMPACRFICLLLLPLIVLMGVSYNLSGKAVAKTSSETVLTLDDEAINDLDPESSIVPLLSFQLPALNEQTLAPAEAVASYHRLVTPVLLRVLRI